jgi:hypothetical protein
MNPDKSDNWGILVLFPLVFFGLAASNSCFRIFALEDYDRKFGQWNAFQMELLLGGFATFIVFIGYLLDLGLVRTAVQRLSGRTTAWIMMTSAYLSMVVLYLIDGIVDRIDDSYMVPVHIHLGAGLVSLVLPPALLAPLLVKTGQVYSASRRSIQR